MNAAGKDSTINGALGRVQTGRADAITATSPSAPWYVVPRDYKHTLQAMAAAIVVNIIGSLDPQWPTVSDEDRDANAKARSRWKPNQMNDGKHRETSRCDPETLEVCVHAGSRVR
jgi:hypothetical protein